MRYEAPAKVNLNLGITGRRDDGFHFLSSLIVFTQWCDFIEISEHDVLSLEVKGEWAQGVPCDERNLVWRAAVLLQEAASVRRGAKISLTKNIPVGAGLGGGSGDAAATIKALCALWNVSPATDALHKMALSLGSDVPVCMALHPAWVEGVGESITPVSLACELWLVLVNPRKPLPTADVYKAFCEPFSNAGVKQHRYGQLDELLGDIQTPGNDLQKAAIGMVPEIADVVAALGSTQGCRLARMSGSGASCFGIYGSEAEAQNARAAIGGAHPGWWCVATKLR